MRISDLHGPGDPVFSFEFFPPKTDEAAAELMGTVADLREALAPDFVSVTYGAGGSTRGRTRECVTRIQAELGITAMAHLTCVGHTQDEIREVVGSLTAGGVENILALRGDPPKGESAFVATEGGFEHATELIAFVRGATATFDIGAACYPEVPPRGVELPTAACDMDESPPQGRCSARDFLVSQLFFDNLPTPSAWSRRGRGRRASTCRSSPGIMPVTNVSQVERFTKMCGATIPEELLDRLRPVQDDPAKVMATGIEHAIKQCRALLEGGAPGVHFYTLNKSHATRSILAAL